jgi:hypothetical protein
MFSTLPSAAGFYFRIICCRIYIDRLGPVSYKVLQIVARGPLTIYLEKSRGLEPENQASQMFRAACPCRAVGWPIPRGYRSFLPILLSVFFASSLLRFSVNSFFKLFEFGNIQIKKLNLRNFKFCKLVKYKKFKLVKCSVL